MSRQMARLLRKHFSGSALSIPYLFQLNHFRNWTSELPASGKAFAIENTREHKYASLTEQKASNVRPNNKSNITARDG